MKTMIRCAVVLLLLAVNFPLTSARAQGTAFTYQGRLNSGGGPANGLFDFRFRLDADPAGNTILSAVFTNSIVVTNGLFTTTMDFGAGSFNGSNYWLEVGVRTNNDINYTTLNPLQQFTPAPYAIFANTASNVLGNVPAANLSGTILNGSLPASPSFSGTVTANNFSGGGANLTSLNANNLSSGTVPLARLPGAVVTNNATGLTLSGTFSGNGSGLTTLNASQLSSGVVPQGVLPSFQAPNYSTIAGGIQNTSSAVYSVVSGGTQNTASGGQSTVGGGSVNLARGAGSTVGGGYNNTAGSFSTVGGGYQNFATGTAFGDATVAGGTGNNATNDFATIGGGQYNNNYGSYGTIAGGGANQIDVGGDHSTIGGGNNNHVVGYESTIGGGYFNLITALDSVIAGGDLNVINSGANQSFIGGGVNNTNTGFLAVIPGGDQNVATNNSFAAGHRAKAIHPGAFVWTDLQNADFSSTVTNQFNVRANGGVRFVTSGAGMTLDGQPVFAGINASGLTNINSVNVSADDSQNILIGVGHEVGGGFENTAIGYQAFFSDTTGDFNTAVGYQALYFNKGSPDFSKGNGNTASGYQALYSNSTGGQNTADGALALFNNISGNNNTASGEEALKGLGSFTGAGGSNNIALGVLAGSALTGNESSNIDIGNIGIQGESEIIRIGTPGIHTQTYLAGVVNGNGSGLTSLNAAQLTSGAVPLAQLPSAVVTNNETSVTLSGTFSGTGSGLTTLNASQLASGTIPLARLPAGVLTNNQTSAVTLSNNLTLSGSLILPDANGSGKTAVIKSGNSLFMYANDFDNFYAGLDAGNTITTGTANTGVGGSSLDVIGGGSFNAALGFASLNSLTSGNANVALGFSALENITTGSGNIAIGSSALYASGTGTGSGSGNIAIGFAAGANYLNNESTNILISHSGVAGDQNIIRIGTPGTHANAYIAGVVTDVGGVQVGPNGTTLTYLQAGQATMPASSLPATNFSITFPHAFTATPKVIASISGDPNFPAATDIFGMTVRAVTTTTGFTVNVMRLDSASSWSQQLRVNWQAWQ